MAFIEDQDCPDGCIIDFSVASGYGDIAKGGMSLPCNMSTFFHKIVRFRYVVQNILRILSANLRPFLTKTDLLRAI